MWEVIRNKYEGYGDGGIENPERNFIANNKHIAKFSCKPNPKEQDPNSCTPAYGSLLYTKICKLTKSDNDILVIKSMKSLQELYKASSKNISASILYTDHQIIPNLVDLTKKEFSKEEALKTLCCAFKCKHGRVSILPHVPSIQNDILSHYQTENPQHVYLTLKLFKGLALEKEACHQMTESEDLPGLVMQCLDFYQSRDIHPKAMKNGLKLLNQLLQVPKTHVLLVVEDRIFYLIEKIFEHTNYDDKVMVALMEHISLLSLYTDGLTKCVRFIQNIMTYLETRNLSLLLQCICALSHITISVEAKYQIMEEQSPIKSEFIRKVTQIFDNYLVTYDNHYIFINNLKVICNIAEKDRKALKELISKIDTRLQQLNNPTVVDELEHTKQVLSWTP
ncbi:hypothetical protein FDP41_010367 [Naegleria fowleri]|uniref:PUL domain-containing protein n=1 Tax=Naegleria fowleri TaxID=5763 RepID=A0A6A5C8N7_NAEFO|nr:uncharacterized protein FDP41_010367 [Naegleria fowleri]KAF0983302.1 hypothetical protein FDP41_010367 [Naegleria fowleri]CAG4713708.1 unnamed protein product [Naegleria fowleri]